MRPPAYSTIAAILCIALCSHISLAQQNAPAETPQQELQRLKNAIDQAQAQVDASQQQLLELKKSLALLEQRLAAGNQTPAPAEATIAPATPPVPPATPAEAQEQQAMQQSQIATLNQVKVESESKYPVKISGLILLNGFVNTSQVDNASAPTIAIAGGGSTGASLRQTVLGMDARGPSLAGATSHADVRVDFFGNALDTNYQMGGILRLRTAHATLNWKDTELFAEMDRPIISPNQPTSLTAIAQPALAWSGNLWMWSPQVGVSHTMDFIGSSRVAVEGALIDVPDSPALPIAIAGTVSQSERSRWPGGELHVGLLGEKDKNGSGASVGIGGYFSPHEILAGKGYNAWAGTLDAYLPLSHGFEFSGSFYRGQALGGLGGGAYKDFVYGTNLQYAKPLDDVGGWVRLKKRAGIRWEFNGAFGLDNGFASELRRYTLPATSYQNQARNQTFTANTIYSPSAYLQFSFEYRHISTAPITGATANTNIIGVAAGYKF